MVAKRPPTRWEGRTDEIGVPAHGHALSFDRLQHRLGGRCVLDVVAVQARQLRRLDVRRRRATHQSRQRNCAHHHPRHHVAPPKIWLRATLGSRRSTKSLRAAAPLAALAGAFSALAGAALRARAASAARLSARSALCFSLTSAFSAAISRRRHRSASSLRGSRRSNSRYNAAASPQRPSANSRSARCKSASFALAFAALPPDGFLAVLRLRLPRRRIVVVGRRLGAALLRARLARRRRRRRRRRGESRKSWTPPATRARCRCRALHLVANRRGHRRRLRRAGAEAVRLVHRASKRPPAGATLPGAAHRSARSLRQIIERRLAARLRRRLRRRCGSSREAPDSLYNS